MSYVIELSNIRKTYTIGDQVQQVLRGVTLSIQQGELLSIMGQSGSGKTTLMNIIGLLDRPDEGEYRFEGQLIENYSNDELAHIRNLKVGFVFQSFFLLPRLNALQNVSLPLLYRGLPEEEMHERALAMLEKVGMKEKAHHKPTELSGGQQQRVAIARALVTDPAVVLADEPTGALDPKIGKEVLDLFIQLNQAEGKTLIIITHDHSVAARCRRQVHMQNGLLIEDAINPEGFG
ncbi:MAG: ABC transporter ATP-binding protein [Gammaproteobacteria bacterium]|nr:ABC transporter ATP-binding protein [Gammaproteobacteria bacterium]